MNRKDDDNLQATDHLPLKIGHTTQAFMQLVPRNCPRETSKKNNGIPQVTRQMINGIRKAPENAQENSRFVCKVHYTLFEKRNFSEHNNMA